MIWLAIQMWVLLMIAFAIGTGAGWWARGGMDRSVRSDDDAVERFEADDDLIGDLKAAPQVRTGLAPVEQIASRPPDVDDLSLIDGVDENLANRLNALGVKRFEQIAAWSPANCAWIEDQIGDRGRIAREGWIVQARAFGEKGDL